MSTRLPTECIEEIVCKLSPKHRFVVATQLRLLFIQSRCLPLICSLDKISAAGRIDILNAWPRRLYGPYGLRNKDYSDLAINVASSRGYVHVLEWWKQRHFSDGVWLKYSSFAMDMASLHGYVEVLEWWKRAHIECGLELKYTALAMDLTVKRRRFRKKHPNGHNTLEVLEWWKQSGLELKYSYRAMDHASFSGWIDVLEWWKQSGLECKFRQNGAHVIYYDRGYTVTPWWNTNGSVLQWWKTSGLV